MSNAQVFIKVVDGDVVDIEGTEGTDIYVVTVNDSYIQEYEGITVYSPEEIRKYIQKNLPVIEEYLVNYEDMDGKYQVEVINARGKENARVKLYNNLKGKLKKICNVHKIKN